MIINVCPLIFLFVLDGFRALWPCPGKGAAAGAARAAELAEATGGGDVMGSCETAGASAAGAAMGGQG